MIENIGQGILRRVNGDFGDEELREEDICNFSGF